ncbi:MAG: hypothetical protein K9L79_00390 [Methylobacter tundripaludum]|nr:hypothetical protein [Methylobacter tundripaludum]
MTNPVRVEGYEVISPIRYDGMRLKPGQRIKLEELGQDEVESLMGQGAIQSAEWLEEAEGDQHQSDAPSKPEQAGSAPGPASVSAEQPKESASGSANELAKPEGDQDNSDSSNMPESQKSLNTLKQASNTPEPAEAPTGQSTEAASDPVSKSTKKK